MSTAKKIPGTIEAWEDGSLGCSKDHARVASDETHHAVEETLAMQMISIRLPKSVIEDFKMLASIEGVGYQPLMREALIRFANGEAKRILRELVAGKKREQEENADNKAA